MFVEAHELKKRRWSRVPYTTIEVLYKEEDHDSGYTFIFSYQPMGMNSSRKGKWYSGRCVNKETAERRFVSKCLSNLYWISSFNGVKVEAVIKGHVKIERRFVQSDEYSQIVANTTEGRFPRRVTSSYY
jgi:hypothetical protein